MMSNFGRGRQFISNAFPTHLLLPSSLTKPHFPLLGGAFQRLCEVVVLLRNIWLAPQNVCTFPSIRPRPKVLPCVPVRKSTGLGSKDQGPSAQRVTLNSLFDLPGASFLLCKMGF